MRPRVAASLPTGELSDTLTYDMARRAAEDGRHLPRDMVASNGCFQHA